MRSPITRQLPAAVSLVSLLALSACSTSDDDDVAEAPEVDAAADEGEDADEPEDDGPDDPDDHEDNGAEASATDLSGVCPSTVVVQADWNPQAEHGELYQMLGAPLDFDDSQKTVTGPLVDSDGNETGVDLEIRAGGPAIGYDSIANQMYTDADILLGYVSTDDAMVAAGQQPVTAVVAPKDISPTAIMWDPETYPDWEDMDDVRESGATVRYTQGLAYMDFLTETGALDPQQVDGSYDGSPGSFVADNGEAAQQGYATAEPYLYDHEIDAWGRALAFTLVADTGYQIYVQALSIRTDQIEEHAACLERLVPMIQQAQIDYLDDPDPANEIIVEAVERYDTGWQYSPGVAEYSVDTQAELGIVSNGHDATLGNMDMDRIDDLIEVMVPILQGQGVSIPDGLSAEDIATNEFIDTSIGLS